MQMGQEIKELTQQCQLTRYRIKNRRQSFGDQFLRIDEYSTLESSDLDLGHRAGVHNSNKDYLHCSENSEGNSLLDVSTPEFFYPDPYLTIVARKFNVLKYWRNLQEIKI